MYFFHTKTSFCMNARDSLIFDTSGKMIRDATNDAKIILFTLSHHLMLNGLYASEIMCAKQPTFFYGAWSKPKNS